MQVHPGKKIQEELKDRGWTQRQFAFLLGKKVSEVNELIKGKRNITVQWDILLSHVLGTSRKYWLELQNEYEYSLVESDFDISKLPNIDQKPVISEEKDHKISEQEIKSENIPPKRDSLHSDSGRKTISPEGLGQEKKEVEVASDRKNNLSKEHKIDKDVDISKQTEKHQKLDSKNDQKIEKKHEKNIPTKQNLPTSNSSHETISSEGQKKGEEKKDKYDRQKIYNPDNKFDSYFPPKEKKLEHKKHEENISSKQDLPKQDFGSKKTISEGQKKGEEKKDDHKDHHKHKEHIFRNF